MVMQPSVQISSYKIVSPQGLRKEQPYHLFSNDSVSIPAMPIHFWSFEPDPCYLLWIDQLEGFKSSENTLFKVLLFSEELVLIIIIYRYNLYFCKHVTVMCELETFDKH